MKNLGAVSLDLNHLYMRLDYVCQQSSDSADSLIVGSKPSFESHITLTRGV